MTTDKGYPASAEGIRFETSGTSGNPIVWERTADQLKAEAEILSNRLNLKDVDLVVNFASPGHLFGMIFGTEIPRMSGARTIDVPSALGPVAAPPSSHLLIVAVPSSWQVIRSVLHHKPDAKVTIVHGAGPIPPGANDLLSLYSHVQVFEVFGATETGAIATRRAFVEADDWLLLDDVTLLGPADNGQLVVRSPRVGRKAGHEPTYEVVLMDHVVRTDERTFLHLGRTDRVVKIDGRRCDLNQLECEYTALNGVPTACVAIPDPLRGWTYELFIEGLQADRIVHGAQGQKIPPRRVREVSPLPRSVRGKVDYKMLARIAKGVS